MPTSILIDTDALLFVKASNDSESVQRLEAFANSIVPFENNFLITGVTNRDLSSLTLMDLQILHRNHTGNELASLEYSKALGEVSQLAKDLPIDNCDISTIKQKKPLAVAKEKPEAPKPAKKEKPVGMPKEGSTSRAIWDFATLQIETYPDTDIDDNNFRDYIITHCVGLGINKSTAGTQFSKWKKFQRI